MGLLSTNPPLLSCIPFVLATALPGLASCAARSAGTTPQEPATAEIASLPTVEVPPTPAGRALLWAIDAVDPTRTLPDSSELQTRLSGAFLNAIPADALVGVFDGLRAQTGGLRLESIEQAVDSQVVAVTRDADGNAWRVFVSASSGAPFVIDGLLYRPAPELDIDAPEDWPGLIAALRDLAPQTALLAARVDGTSCTPIASHAAEVQVPVGSAFKLWVLAALLDAVRSGDTAWDALLPSSERTVFDAAEAMISTSDNPSTDELIHLMGRTFVEEAQGRWGMLEPEWNIPFLTTLDLFVLKGTRDGELGRAYLDADPGRRAELLAEIAPEDIGAMRMWTEPTMLGIEWFASANDLCRVMALVHDRADVDDSAAPARHILSVNPGIAIRSEDWLYAAYKGGSEPGVINLTWLLEDSERQRWFFSMTAVHPDARIDEGLAVALAAIGVDLLADE